MATIDLHVHSTASDGTFEPEEVVRLAKTQGLSAMALTDHDTVSGLPRAVAAGKAEGVEVIPGCELSVEVAKGVLHIVGLWVPVHGGTLALVLEDLRAKRHSRNERIVAKLAEAGISITYDEVKSLAGDAAVGRPHIARVLMAKKAAASVDDAFHRLLGPNGRAYVPKEKLNAEQAIKVLKDVQATVILAHPFSLGLRGPVLEEFVISLKALGLDGIEAYYPEHDQMRTEGYIRLAQKLNLLVSGGSDFHGSVKPDIQLGKGRGGLMVPEELLTEMKKQRRSQGLPV